MHQRTRTRFALVTLCLLITLSTAVADTRTGVICLEGMEEAIEETLFQSEEGFSFWYAGDALEADFIGRVGMVEGVMVQNRYSDDYMVLSIISGEQAAAYARDLDAGWTAQSGRTQVEIYCELEENGRFHFMTLIAENGRYLRAVGAYSLEAAEGIARYFQMVLDSLSLAPAA